MIKRTLKDNMTDFLQTRNKLSDRNSRKINIDKQNTSLKETSSRKPIIRSLSSPDHKNLPVSIQVIIKFKFQSRNINIVMIDEDRYSAARC